MVQPRRVAAVLLHGLPFPNQSNALDQLTDLRAVVEGAIPPGSVTAYDWLADVRAPSVRNATVSALLGTLGATVARAGRFAETMSRLCAEHERIAVVGYSAGGWVVYHWLTTAPERERRRVDVFFAIGAPYQNSVGDLFFGDSNEPAVARIWQNLPVAALARALSPGRLHTILSLADRTIWPANARFPEEYRTTGLVRELVLASATHRQLPYHPDVLSYLRAELTSRLR